MQALKRGGCLSNFLKTKEYNYFFACRFMEQTSYFQAIFLNIKKLPNNAKFSNKCHPCSRSRHSLIWVFILLLKFSLVTCWMQALKRSWALIQIFMECQKSSSEKKRFIQNNLL